MFKINMLKNFINIIKSTEHQKELLKNINIGDLVWAKMPLSKREINKIEESHRNRPYLVVHKDLANIFAYQSSSKQHNNLNNCQEYFINRLRYKQNKDSWINLTKLIKVPINNLQSKYLTLNQFDLKNIQKRLKIQSNKNTIQLQIDIYISEGDIVNINQQLYYVYSTDNAYLYCFKITKKEPKDNKKYEKIIVNNKTYYASFKEIYDFKRTTQMSIVNIAYQSEITEILRKKKGEKYSNEDLSTKEKRENVGLTEVVYENGTVFQIGTSKVVYLFKVNGIHYGVDLLMYKVKPRTFQIHNIDKKQIVEILPLEEYIKIIEFLSLNNVQPLKPINRLYEELRIMVYK